MMFDGLLMDFMLRYYYYYAYSQHAQEDEEVAVHTWEEVSGRS